jgi:myo-inositol-1(or 4)-monophosphatase
MLEPGVCHALCEIARQAAAAAAAAVRGSRRPYHYTGGVNAGGDRVLEIDLAADAEALTWLAKGMERLALPYSTLSEESGLHRHGADYPLFLVDPVDGSAQARRLHPDCSVSIAIASGPTMADLVVGIVQPIMSGDPYVAIAGEGAWQGDRALPRIPPPSGPATSVLLEGPDAASTAALVPRFAAAVPSCQIHASGSIALQLALLAAGCYDVLVACRPGAHAHDVAAGWLLVREAGSAFADLEGLDIASAALIDGHNTYHCAAARRQDLLEQAIFITRGEPLSSPVA